MLGRGGSDPVCAGRGNNRVLGGGGNDRLYGEAGKDTLAGGTGRDTLWGGWGNDLLNADDQLGTNNGLNDAPDTHPSYEDRAYGGAGRDVLIGNTGGDRLIDQPLRAAQVRQAIDVLWQLSHDPLLATGRLRRSP